MAIKAKYVKCVGCKATYNLTAKPNQVIVPINGKKIKTTRCPKCGLVQLEKASDKKSELIEKIIEDVDGPKADARKRAKRYVDKMSDLQISVAINADEDSLDNLRDYLDI